MRAFFKKEREREREREGEVRQQKMCKEKTETSQDAHGSIGRMTQIPYRHRCTRLPIFFTSK